MPSFRQKQITPNTHPHLFFILSKPLPPLLNNVCLGNISDQKANKSSVVADSGQVLSELVWGENAEVRPKTALFY